NEQYALAQLFMLRREETRLGEIVKDIEGLPQRYPAVSFWRPILGWSYAELGRAAEARRELARLAIHDFNDIPRDAFWLGCMIAISEMVTLLGDKNAARHVYRLLSPFAGRYLMEFSVCFGSVARSL